MASNLYSFDNEVFAGFVFYGTLVLIKTVLMSLTTSFTRIKNRSFCSIEDAKVAAPNNPEKQKLLLRRNESVERVSLLRLV